MKALKKRVYDKKYGKIIVYELLDVPMQLRFADAARYQRVILGNSNAFDYLRKVFILAASLNDEKSIIHIRDNSMHGERYEEWFQEGMFHMDLVVSNYHIFTAKPKYIKRIVDKSKKVLGEELILEYKDMKLTDIPYWAFENTQQVKSYGKYMIFSSNKLGYLDLARSANRLIGLKDVETYMCDFHIHLDDNTSTDFWYYYESHNE